MAPRAQSPGGTQEEAISVLDGLRRLLSVVVYSFFALVLLLAALLIWGRYGSEGRRRSAYGRVQVGVPYAQLLDVYGRPPDTVVTCGRCRVGVYFGHALGSEEPGVFPETISTLRELPEVYDSMQFLVSEDDVTVAKAWCGESTVVHVFSGLRRGSSLSSLDGDVLQRLNLEYGCANDPDLGNGREEAPLQPGMM